MPLITNNPITEDGKTYDRLLLNLAISPLEQGSDIGASVAMRLTPYCDNGDGTISKKDDAVINQVFLDAFTSMNGDEALTKAVTTIMGSIQTYINDKQL